VSSQSFQIRRHSCYTEFTAVLIKKYSVTGFPLWLWPCITADCGTEPRPAALSRGQRWRPVQPTAGGQCNLVLQLPASPGCALLAARTLWRASAHTTQPWQASSVGWASSRPGASEGRRELDEEDRRAIGARDLHINPKASRPWVMYVVLTTTTGSKCSGYSYRHTFMIMIH
jgi:hypothetical protein